MDAGAVGLARVVATAVSEKTCFEVGHRSLAFSRSVAVLMSDDARARCAAVGVVVVAGERVDAVGVAKTKVGGRTVKRVIVSVARAKRVSVVSAALSFVAAYVAVGTG